MFMKNGQDLILDGFSALKGKDAKSAKRSFQACLEKDPENEKAHYGMAIANVLIGVNRISILTSMGYQLARFSCSGAGLKRLKGLLKLLNRMKISLPLNQALEMFLRPVDRSLNETLYHLSFISDNFRMNIDSLPISLTLDVPYTIDLGGYRDASTAKLAKSIINDLRFLSIFLQSIDLNIKSSSIAQLISRFINIDTDPKSPLDTLASMRALGLVFGENPNFLQFRKREKLREEGVPKLREALAETEEWMEKLVKNGGDHEKVIGFIKKDIKNDTKKEKGSPLLTLRFLKNLSFISPLWLSEITFEEAEEMFESLRILCGTIRDGLDGKESYLHLSGLNGILKIFGLSIKIDIPDAARIDLKTFVNDWLYSHFLRDFLPKLCCIDGKYEFLIEAEVGKNTRFDLSKWVFKGDHKHFGVEDTPEIGADGVVVPESNNVTVIPYIAWNDPSFGNSLHIRDEKGKFVVADQFSLNKLTANGARALSLYIDNLTVQKPEKVEKSMAIESKFVEHEKVRRMDVKFRNRDGHMLAGRLYWPKDASTSVYPGIVYCEGTFSWRDLYHWMGMHLARNGYAVLVFDPGGQCDSNGRGMGDYWFKHFSPPGWEFDLYDAITYLTEYSPIKNLVERIGTMGHSRGSVAVAEEQVFDERVKACVEVSMTDYFSSSKSRVPTQIQTADFDLLIGGYLNSLLYTVTNPPKQIIVVEGGSHNGFCTRKEEGAETGIYHWPMSPKWQHEISGYYALAWFDYYLKGEKSARRRITTPLKHLSKIYPFRYELG